MRSFIVLGLSASAACLSSHTPFSTSQAPTQGAPSLDAAFSSWAKKHDSQTERMISEVNRLAHPDVPVWLNYEGQIRPAIVPGSAKVDQLQRIVTRLHRLDRHEQLNFIVNGAPLPKGVAISETPLANSRMQEVQVTAAPWWSKAGTQGSLNGRVYPSSFTAF